MKKSIISWTLLLAVVGLFAQNDGNLYSSKSGKMAYRYDLGETESTYGLYFDDFGKKQAIELTTTIDGYPQKTRTIITTENIYIINYDDKQVIKFPVDTDDESMDSYGSEGGVNLSTMVGEVTGATSAKSGTGVVLGKTCDIYIYTDPVSGAKGKYWVYKTYLFKAEFLDDNGQHAFMEVIDFMIDTSIDAKEFAVPASFEVMDMSKTMEQMKQMQEMYGVPEN